MQVGAGLADHGVEAVDGVGRVVHRPDRAVGFNQGVLPLDDVPVPRLRLVLVVAGVGVVNAVLERVLRVALERKNNSWILMSLEHAVLC